MSARLAMFALLATDAAAAPAAPRPVDVAIVGGGPCGLAAALALSKARCLRGASIEVFERDDFGPKGATISISEHGWAAVTAIDEEAARRIRTTGAPLTRVSIRALDGASLGPAPGMLIAAGGWFLWLLRRMGIRRPLGQSHLWHDVREVLRNRVEECGIARLRPSKTLAEVAEGADAVQLRFEDGEEVAAKVVFACDGTRSSCRRLLPSEPDDLLIDEQKSVWRGQARGLVTHGAATMYKDEHGRSGLVFPAGSGQGSSWTFIAASVPGRSKSSDEARARLAAALPDALDATLRRAIDGSPLVIEGKLMTRDFSKPWASSAPRVAFLGDAAHPLRPTGEGTALALEDAWTIGRLAADSETADEFCAPGALRRYEEARLARVEAVSDAVRAAAKRFYQKDYNSEATIMTVGEAFAAHPLVCTPLSA